MLYNGKSRGEIVKNLFSTLRPASATFFFSVAIVVLVVGTAWFVNRLHIEEIRKEVAQILDSQGDYRIFAEDVDWTWLGGLGVRLSGVTVRFADTEAVFANIKEIYIDVAIVPLLLDASEIILNEIVVTGVSLKFEILPDGSYLWHGAREVAEPKVESLFEALVPTPRAFNTQRGANRLAFKPDILTLENVVVECTDQQGSCRLQLDYLQARGLQNTHEARIVTRGHFATTNLAPVHFDLAGIAHLPLRGLEANRRRLDSRTRERRTLTGQGITTAFVEERLSPVEFFMPMGTSWQFQVTQGRLQSDGGLSYDLPQMEISWLDDVMRANGRIQGDVVFTLTDFILRQPLSPVSWEGQVRMTADQAASLNALSDFSVPTALHTLSLNGYLLSTEDGFLCKQATVHLNEDIFQGELRVGFEDSLKIRLHGQASHLNLDTWLEQLRVPASSLSQSSVPAIALSKPETSPLLPETQTNIMRRYKWELLLQLDQLMLANLPMRNASFVSQFDGNALSLSVNAGQVLGGSFNMRLAVDFVPENPLWQFYFVTDQVDLTALSQWLSLRLGVAGTASIDGYATLRGATRAGVLDSIDGRIEVFSDDGLVDVTDIKQYASRFAAVTGDEDIIAAWPDQFRFHHLQASLTMPQGIADQRIEIQVDGLAVAAEGQINPFQQHMDLDVRFWLKEHLYTASLNAISGHFRDIQWPLYCQGNYTYNLPCRLVTGGASQILSDLQAAQNRAYVPRQRALPGIESFAPSF